MRGVIQNEVVGHFVRSDVDDFETVVIVGADVDLLVVGRESQAARKSGDQLDGVGDFALRFVDHQHQVGVGAAE